MQLIWFLGFIFQENPFVPGCGLCLERGVEEEGMRSVFLKVSLSIGYGSLRQERFQENIMSLISSGSCTLKFLKNRILEGVFK